MTPKRDSTPNDEEPSPKKAKSASSIINEYNEDYQDPEADVTLISSDGLRFKVHSYVLKTVSVVFRDMLSLKSPDNEEIELTDKKIERGATLTMLLDISHAKPFGQPEHNMARHPYQLLIKLATKYECDHVIQQFTAVLYRWIPEGIICPLSVFFLGCDMDSLDVMAFAIQSGGGWVYVEDNKCTANKTKAKPTERVGEIDTVVGASVIDPGGMSLTQVKEIPSVYLWALMRVTRNRIEKNPRDSNWNQMAKDFKKLVKDLDDDE